MKCAWLCMIILSTAASGSAAFGEWFQSYGPDNLAIAVEGDCPGRITVRWEGATPDRWAGLWFSRSQGSFTLPGPCAGTVLGLGPNGLRLARVFQSGPEGEGVMAGRAPSYACGGYLQMIVQDGNPCTTSNVVQIPQ